MNVYVLPGCAPHMGLLICKHAQAVFSTDCARCSSNWLCPFAFSLEYFTVPISEHPQGVFGIAKFSNFVLLCKL